MPGRLLGTIGCLVVVGAVVTAWFALSGRERTRSSDTALERELLAGLSRVEEDLAGVRRDLDEIRNGVRAGTAPDVVVRENVPPDWEGMCARLKGVVDALEVELRRIGSAGAMSGAVPDIWGARECWLAGGSDKELEARRGAVERLLTRARGDWRGGLSEVQFLTLGQVVERFGVPDEVSAVDGQAVRWMFVHKATKSVVSLSFRDGYVVDAMFTHG